MADTKLSGLTAGTVVNDIDELYIVQGGASKRATASLVGLHPLAELPYATIPADLPIHVWTLGTVGEADTTHLLKIATETAPGYYMGATHDIDWYGVPNRHFFIGWNRIGISGTPEDAAYSSLTWTIEQYQTGPVIPDDYWDECYFEWWSPANTYTARMFHCTFQPSTGIVQSYTTGNFAVWHHTTSVPMITLYETGAIGAASAYLTGVSNAVQLTVKGYSTQTNPILQVLDSTGGDLFSVDSVGRIGVGMGVVATSAISASLSYTTYNSTTVAGISVEVARKDATGTNNFYGFQQSISAYADAQDSHIAEYYGLVPACSFVAASGKTLTVDSSGGILITTPVPLGAGTNVITLQSGIRIRNQGASGVVNAYGLYIETQSGAATSNTPLYVQSGTAWFGGSIGVGIQTALDPIQIHTAAVGAGDKIGLSLGAGDLGNTVGGAVSIAWRYVGGSTVFAEMQGVTISGGLELVFHTYDSAAMTEKLRLGAKNVSSVDFDLASTKVYKVNNVQVVGARVIDARADDTADSGDATTDGLIDALRDAMITHGLIAAA